jgi:hypothetical protein
MVKKKSALKKKAVGRRKSTAKSKGRAAKIKRVARKRPIAKKRTLAKKRTVAKKKAVRRKRRVARGKQETGGSITVRSHRGLGAAAGGQSGDTQGLSRIEEASSESVEELLEEGQYFEAEAVSGVENAKDPDQGEVTTSQVPEDDVPPEYTDRD